MSVWMAFAAVGLFPFFALSQQRYDVVITEIMADPSPAVGLPAVEWIEIRNRGTTTFQLQGWRVADASGQSGPLPAFLLQPDSALIICSSGSLAAMSVFGTARSVTSFPSLDNDGDVLTLRAASGMTVHAIAYENGWMENELKQQGGWTLEMIDPRRPCLGATNWTASLDPAGGTPGRINSVDGMVEDGEPPYVIRSFAHHSSGLKLVWSEPLDSAAAVLPSHYALPGFNITGISVKPPLFTEVELGLAAPLDSNKVYEVRISGVKDCEGNAAVNASVRTGLATAPKEKDCIINELLFDPRSGADDWVELYNRSGRILDLSILYIANRNATGQVSSILPISAGPQLLFPGEYVVLTENADLLAIHYLVKNPANIIEMPALPSWPDDEGKVLLLDMQGKILDELNYHRDWHFRLISEPEGVSLERLRFDGDTQDPMNWHSAASTAGYGTPGYKNSQAGVYPATPASFNIQPKIFSPDNDGRDDVAILSYALEDPGYAASVTVFDYAGVPVRYLVRNKLAGTNGFWTWDGLDEKGMKLPVGIYVVLAELFHPGGKKLVFKLPLVLARPF